MKNATPYTVNRALNYGSVGSTIGHELSHSYDDTGRLYNELGNVVTWWTNKSAEEYADRSQCLVDHYNRIQIVGPNNTVKVRCRADIVAKRLGWFRGYCYIHRALCSQIEVDGALTLDENIADITGLKDAHIAYRRYVDVHGPEPRLPGLEQYSQEQMFFLAYANVSNYYVSVPIEKYALKDAFNRGN